MKKYRNLTANEKEQLINQNNQSKNWNDVQVAEDFTPKNIVNCSFSGKIKLGVYDGSIELEGGIDENCGLYNTRFHNCTIGDNAFIDRVNNYIANYEIDNHVIIFNIDVLLTNGLSTFGNNNKVAVLDETGGREIAVFDKLSAQMAYLLTIYRHRPKLIENLQKLIEKYTNGITSDIGYIGEGSKIINAGTIRNVRMLQNTVVNSAKCLENGSLMSCQNHPIEIGNDVVMRNFIVGAGTKVIEGSLVTDCFIGQGCKLARQYSAENSVFFSNFQGYHGEACSIFAGPFTVTHHKSTLLIAGMYSFMNAGSGSNQSNHMYKLGPMHQGIVERGSKTASDSYLLWPARIGAFTLVMGRHYKNSDTSDLPFSYLIEGQNESLMFPAINIRSVGTIRDAQKWPARDGRRAKQKVDLINFNLLSPFTVQKMIRGTEILKKLQEISGNKSEVYVFENVKIKNTSLLTGLKLYKIGIVKFLGNALIKRLSEKKPRTINDLRTLLKDGMKGGTGDWVDIAGMFASKKGVMSIIENIENEQLNSVDEIADAFKTLHNNYYELAWSWVSENISSHLSKPIDEINVDDIKNLVLDWKNAVVDLDEMLLKDARKEFTLTSKTSFGHDGNAEEMHQDFEMVRGRYESHKSVKAIKEHIEKKSKLAESALELLDNIK